MHAFTPLRHCNTPQSSVESWRGVLLRRIFIKHRVGPTRTRASLQHPSIIRGLMARCADPQVDPTRMCASLQHPSIIRGRMARRADPQCELIRGATYSNRTRHSVQTGMAAFTPYNPSSQFSSSGRSKARTRRMNAGSNWCGRGNHHSCRSGLT